MDKRLVATLGPHRAAVVGIALGIMMERMDVDAAEASLALARLASEQDRPAYAVAEEIVQTRGLNESGAVIAPLLPAGRRYSSLLF